ncbi:hypothetical protein A2Z67_06500 [Candidatus Woesebacteria bacterium RBG_13_36_22]|uniref:ASCH domain-containing protein n=1 Tax=Candidatus Woesebacteria bacterium RBG_13_36_22 TaxID=1802478 RepID=A0A1F7X1V1_9BACT|nr:MAG: hypothetical protein A2Z67_06500 [Candidatus Woesebacteria bacterium RBG_13_36_22]
MDHVAIMKKSWGMIPRILSKEKTIESRWYKKRSTPWGKIKKGDTIYFKNSGEPVTVKVKVNKVKEFEDLTPKKIKEILPTYYRFLGVSDRGILDFYNLVKDKKYCILIFLKNVEKLEKTYDIRKSGFGMMASWISVEDIEKIKTL